MHGVSAPCIHVSGEQLRRRVVYAIVMAGGKQYRVKEGDELTIDRLEGESGDSIELGPVLLVGDGEETTIGTPAVDGAVVNATILEQGRGKKKVVFKYKAKKRYRIKKGHRQPETRLKIESITL